MEEKLLRRDFPLEYKVKYVIPPSWNGKRQIFALNGRKSNYKTTDRVKKGESTNIHQSQRFYLAFVSS